MVQIALFEYEILDTDTRTFVKEKAQNIHARLKRTAEDIIAIGLDLKAVQDKLPDMKFSAWIRAEFEMSRPTAYRFMSVASRLGNSCLTVRQLSVKVLYELASPSTPETVIEMVESGQVEPTISAIREAKQEVRKEEAERELQREAVPAIHPTLVVYTSRSSEETLYAPPIVQPVIQAREEVYTPVEPVKSATLTALQSSESNEWYTPAQYVDTARVLMGKSHPVGKPASIICLALPLPNRCSSSV